MQFINKIHSQNLHIPEFSNIIFNFLLGFWKRPHPCLRYGQVPFRSLVLNFWAISTYPLIHGTEATSRLWPCIYQNWIFQYLQVLKTSQKTLTRYQNTGNFFSSWWIKPLCTSRISAFKYLMGVGTKICLRGVWAKKI